MSSAENSFGRRQFLRVAGLATAGLALNGAARSSSARPVTIAAAGDCIITRAIRNVSHEPVQAAAQLVRDADVGFGNCEMTFHDLAGYPAPTGACGDLNLFADPAIAEELSWAGFNLMSLANNHTLDYGHDGLSATINNLEGVGIVPAGAGRNLAAARSPRYIETQNGRVALVACASTYREGSDASPSHSTIPGRPGLSPLRVQPVYGIPREQLKAIRQVSRMLSGSDQKAVEDASVTSFLGSQFRVAAAPETVFEANPSDVTAILQQVRRAAAEADIVLVSIHTHEAGADLEQPAEFLKPFARACIDAGAHAFFGHGKHLIWPIEMYKDRPIFYGLGNYYFQAETIRQIPQEIYRTCNIDSHSPSDFFKKVMGGMFEQAVYWESILPRMVFRGGRLEELKLYPIDLYWSRPATQRGTPGLARGQTAARVLDRAARLSKPFGTSIERRGDIAHVKV